MPKRTQIVATVRRFVRAVNTHDAAVVASLVTAGHEFTDSRGDSVRGRKSARAAWIDYFKLIPDYRMEVERTLCQGDAVILLGWASGTCAITGKLQSRNSWRIPAAWYAKVQGNLISGWQVYADNKPVYEILAGREGPARGK